MVEFKLFGKVLPLHREFTMRFGQALQWSDGGRSITFAPKIDAGIIEIDCSAENVDKEIVDLASSRGLVTVRGLVNLYCFAAGEPFTVLIDEIQYPDGKRENILHLDDYLVPLNTAIDLSDLSQTGPLVMQEPSTLIALNDAVMALSQPFYVPIGCGRAVDGIRQAFVTEDNTRNQQWTAMQTALRLTPEYQRHVSEASAKPRHAEARSFTPDEIREILKRTWTIINRYLEYRKRGNQLPESEFPLL